jgi:CRP-like cAMP-binding protein
MGGTVLGKVYDDGEIIVRQGDKGDCMFVIQLGAVEVVEETDGNELVLAVLNAGDFFGEMAIFEQQVRSATVRARGEARVLTVDRRTLMRRIQNDPSVAFNILHTMSHRIRVLDQELGRVKAMLAEFVGEDCASSRGDK